jgi:hypothetical protein
MLSGVAPPTVRCQEDVGEQEEDEVACVAQADAVVDPPAMVVEARDAPPGRTDGIKNTKINMDHSCLQMQLP